MTKLGRYARDDGVHIAVATQAGRTVDEDFPGGGYLFAPDGACIAPHRPTDLAPFDRPRPVSMALDDGQAPAA